MGANDSIFGNLLRIGEVVSADPIHMTARVKFDDCDGMVSYDLQVLCQNTAVTKDYGMPARSERVLCCFLPNGLERGFILGSFYTDTAAPPVTDAAKRHTVFADGTVIEYDAATHELKADVKGKAAITTTGDLLATVAGALTATVTGALTAKADGAAQLESAASALVKAPTITLQGNVTVTGTLTAQQTVTATGTVTGAAVTDSTGTMAAMRTAYNAHGGHASTGTPVPQM